MKKFAILPLLLVLGLSGCVWYGHRPGWHNGGYGGGYGGGYNHPPGPGPGGPGPGGWH